MTQVIVKIRGATEWWVGNTLQDIKHLSADRSIKTGQLVLFDPVDELPENVGVGDYSMVNVVVYRVHSRLNNAEYQRHFRIAKLEAGMTLMRIWVPKKMVAKIKRKVMEMIK